MKNHENWLDLVKITYFQSVITLLLFLIATNRLLHKKDNIFMVQLGKLKRPFFLKFFFFNSMFISVEDRTGRIRFSYNYSMIFTCSQ